ncbi:MAG: FecR domain-containing protein [Nitrospirae bacterium]|nr:FecR domain-containing protein [Nitrospirota bacterium]
MGKRRKRIAAVVGALTLCLVALEVLAQNAEQDGIGVIVTVQGNVTVDHPDPSGAVQAKVEDHVLFKDIIETRKESRTKTLFDNDSVLTVGENSRVEITEYIYDPSQSTRSMVVKLVQGRLRALVGKVFAQSGSKFEVHTPTAVAAARGTYFVVWVEGGTSGVVNIGNSGRVDFTSGGQTVSIDPNQFSLTSGGGVPTQPAYVASGVPPSVSIAIVDTELKSSPKPQKPIKVVNANASAKEGDGSRKRGGLSKSGGHGKDGEQEKGGDQGRGKGGDQGQGRGQGQSSGEEQGVGQGQGGGQAQGQGVGQGSGRGGGGLALGSGGGAGGGVRATPPGVISGATDRLTGLTTGPGSVSSGGSSGGGGSSASSDGGGGQGQGNSQNTGRGASQARGQGRGRR